MNPDYPEPHSPAATRRSILIGTCALAITGCSPAGDGGGKAATPENPSPSLPATGNEKIVTMLGDSITAGFGLAASDALPAQLEKALRAKGLSARVRAAGVSGDTTAGGLARLDFSVQNDTDLCIVALGANDMLQGTQPETVKSNLQAIIDRLKARRIPVLLVGMKAPPQYGTYAAEFEKVFTHLAKENNVATYPFLLAGVALADRYNQADGIHPNAEGVKIMVAGLVPVVEKALTGS